MCDRSSAIQGWQQKSLFWSHILKKKPFALQCHPLINHRHVLINNLKKPPKNWFAIFFKFIVLKGKTHCTHLRDKVSVRLMFIFIYTESLHLENKGSGSTIKRDQIKENILHGFKIEQINYNQSGPNINVFFVAMRSKVDVISQSWAKQRLFSTVGWNYHVCCWHSRQLLPCINAIMHTNTPVIKR